MRHARFRTAPRLLPAAALAAILATVATPALAERVGQVRAVDIEEQSIVIDGRTYSLASDLVPRYAASGRLVDLRRVRAGMPVEYEVGTGGTIVRLVLLADD